MWYSQGFMCVAATGTASYAHVRALKLNYVYGRCYVLMCMHTCDTAKLESQRTADNKTPGDGAQRPRAALNYYYTGGHAGGSRGHHRDRRAHRGPKRHHEDRRAQRGGRRDTKRTGGNTGGIGAGRKAASATRTQHRSKTDPLAILHIFL